MKTPTLSATHCGLWIFRHTCPCANGGARYVCDTEDFEFWAACLKASQGGPWALSHHTPLIRAHMGRGFFRWDFLVGELYLLAIFLARMSGVCWGGPHS